MSANLDLEANDYTARAPSEINWDESDGSHGVTPDRWLIQSLDELAPGGEFAGVSATALDAILAVADRIEHGGYCRGRAEAARGPYALFGSRCAGAASSGKVIKTPNQERPWASKGYTAIAAGHLLFTPPAAQLLRQKMEQEKGLTFFLSCIRQNRPKVCDANRLIFKEPST